MNSSRVSSEPVTWSLVCLEHLLSELLVSTILDGVNFESMGVAVNEMSFGEKVGDWIESSNNGETKADQDFGVWNLSAGNVHEIFGDIMSHLWSGGRSSIFILDHTIMQLWGHSNDHVIVVWVEVSTLWNIVTEWGVVMVTGQKIVGVVDQTWGEGEDLG